MIGEDVKPFVAVTHMLKKLNLSAPMSAWMISGVTLFSIVLFLKPLNSSVSSTLEQSIVLSIGPHLDHLQITSALSVLRLLRRCH